MDSNENARFGFKKSSEKQINNQESDVSGDWKQFGASEINIMVSANASTAVDSVSTISSSCSSDPAAGFFDARTWNLAGNSASLDFNFVPSMVSGVFPSSLLHFPSDSAFIERAARFSCFSGGNLNGLISSSAMNSSLTSNANFYETVLGDQTQRTESETTDIKDIPQHDDPKLKNGNSTKEQNCYQETSQVSAFSTDLAEGSQELNANLVDAATNSSPSDLSVNKRKSINQDVEIKQEQQDLKQQKGNKNSSKPMGKHVKDSSENSIKDYIHVRARHGQATNSHSLAERVRREKISERMKYLQDLVPGCGKVTGKAVMLDEIINYVQSLQRQVKFLSMKLATVNPQLDFNIGLLAKDILPSRVGLSSTIGFQHEVNHPQICLSQPTAAPIGISGIVNPYNAFRRTRNPHLTTTGDYEEPMLKVDNPWNVEL